MTTTDICNNRAVLDGNNDNIFKLNDMWEYSPTLVHIDHDTGRPQRRLRSIPGLMNLSFRSKSDLDVVHHFSERNKKSVGSKASIPESPLKRNTQNSKQPKPIARTRTSVSLEEFLYDSTTADSTDGSSIADYYGDGSCNSDSIVLNGQQIIDPLIDHLRRKSVGDTPLPSIILANGTVNGSHRKSSATSKKLVTPQNTASANNVCMDSHEATSAGTDCSSLDVVNRGPPGRKFDICSDSPGGRSLTSTNSKKTVSQTFAFLKNRKDTVLLLQQKLQDIENAKVIELEEIKTEKEHKLNSLKRKYLEQKKKHKKDICSNKTEILKSLKRENQELKHRFNKMSQYIHLSKVLHDELSTAAVSTQRFFITKFIASCEQIAEGNNHYFDGIHQDIGVDNEHGDKAIV